MTILEIQQGLLKMSEAKKTRILRIKELFLKLKSGYDYISTNESKTDKCQKVWDRSQVIFEELETVGVSKDFSQALEIFGAEVTRDLLSQFEM